MSENCTIIDYYQYAKNEFIGIEFQAEHKGNEFQAKFHWHVEDLGMEHNYIKARTPQLNSKVERSHLTDKSEFYKLITYKDDVDLIEKLNQWENF